MTDTDTYPVYATKEDFTPPIGFLEHEPGAPPEPIGRAASETEAIAIIRAFDLSCGPPHGPDHTVIAADLFEHYDRHPTLAGTEAWAPSCHINHDIDPQVGYLDSPRSACIQLVLQQHERHWDLRAITRQTGDAIPANEWYKANLAIPLYHGPPLILRNTDAAGIIDRIGPDLPKLLNEIKARHSIINDNPRNFGSPSGILTAQARSTLDQLNHRIARSNLPDVIPKIHTADEWLSTRPDIMKQGLIEILHYTADHDIRIWDGERAIAAFLQSATSS